MATARKSAQKRRDRPKKNRTGIWAALAVFVLLAGYVVALEYSRPHVGGEGLRFDTFVDLAKRGQIKNALILDEDAYVVGDYTPDDRPVPAGELARYNTPLLRGTQGGLLEILLQNRIPTTIDQQVGKRVASLASILLPGLILVVLFVYLILSYRRGTGLFGVRSGARKITTDQESATFADVAGQEAAVTELKEIKDFLSDPERFTDIGAQVPKGILLFGPPGCGKTLLAKALAGEAGANFYSISGSDFVELYVGVGASRVRELFKEARENVPALVFIDELDSIGRARGTVGSAQSHGEQEQALNQVLAEMDGFSPSEGIIVIGATNRPDVLDQALLRPGRFDRTIGLERPTEAARLAILSLHARGKRLEPTVDLAAIAGKAIGLTGADLASVMNEGALLAVRGGKQAISQAELDQSLQRILAAPERQRRLSLRERSIGRRFSSEERVTFADVAGVDEAIEELAEVKLCLAEPERFARIGGRLPRGILLAGPPGCGKTLLAKAVAGEANAAFISVAGSEFVEVFVGEGASRVRELFADARSVAPAIVFIDEIDAIGARRGVSMDGQREREQTLNQILVELDGFDAQSAVVVIAATNRPDILDPALIRPGRFDRQVTISLPDRAGRRNILALHSAGKRLAGDVDLEVVAGLTQGFAGADLANVLNEAALLTGRWGREEISMAAVEEGIDRAVLGVASRGVVLTKEELLMVAYHEAGHALVAHSLPGTAAPHKLTILPRGGSLGRCTRFDIHDRVIATRAGLIDQMATLLGGWAAEELVFGDIASGAASDLERVSEIANEMVRRYGMSETLGPIVYPDRGGLTAGRIARHSEKVAEMIDAETRKLVDESCRRARSALTMSRPALAAVAQALLERETLSARELEAIAGASQAPSSALADDPTRHVMPASEPGADAEVSS